MRLRHLFEAEGKTAVVAFGRMNPPTIGHAKLVDRIKSIQGDHYVFLSQSQKPKTDPLPFADKLRYAKFFFPEITIGNPEVRTPIQMMQHLEGLGYTDIIYVAGSDRAPAFDKLFNDYNGKDYTFNSIEVVSAGERDPDADGAEGMSASKMRAAAADGDLESFKQGVPQQEVADEMFAAVRKGMGISEDASSDEEDEFHRKLDKLVHKTFGHSSDEKKMKKTNEKAPPGREDQVKALKKEFPDDEGAPYAIAWAQHNKKKKKTNESESATYYIVTVHSGGTIKRYKFDGDKFADSNEAADFVTKIFDKKGVSVRVKATQYRKKESVSESDVVIDPVQLRSYLRMLIDDAIDKEQDIDKLSKVLKILVGKEIKNRGKRYQITSEDVITAFEASCKNRRKKNGYR